MTAKSIFEYIEYLIIFFIFIILQGDVLRNLIFQLILILRFYQLKHIFLEIIELAVSDFDSLRIRLILESHIPAI